MVYNAVATIVESMSEKNNPKQTLNICISIVPPNVRNSLLTYLMQRHTKRHVGSTGTSSLSDELGASTSVSIAASLRGITTSGISSILHSLENEKKRRFREAFLYQKFPARLHVKGRCG